MTENLFSKIPEGCLFLRLFVAVSQFAIMTWRWFGWIRAPRKGEKVTAGFKQVLIMWGIVTVLGVSSFFVAQKDLDRRRIASIKKSKKYGKNYHLTENSAEERQREQEGARRRAVQRQVEIEEKEARRAASNQ